MLLMALFPQRDDDDDEAVVSVWMRTEWRRSLFRAKYGKIQFRERDSTGNGKSVDGRAFSRTHDRMIDTFKTTEDHSRQSQ